MNKNLLTLTGILGCIIVISVYIWSTHNRYYIQMGQDGYAYEIDRLTGDSWILAGKNRIRHESPLVIATKEVPLPWPDLAKLAGSASLSYGTFSGSFYNGSNKEVSKIIVSITLKEAGGLTRWTRDYSIEQRFPPMKSSSFSIAVSDDYKMGSFLWNVKSAFVIDTLDQ